MLTKVSKLSAHKLLIIWSDNIIEATNVANYMYHLKTKHIKINLHLS